MTQSSEQNIANDDLFIPAFGYELIREELLTEILGKDAQDILYWAGKRLARTYPLASIVEMVDFFESAGWGTLEVIKESKNELQFKLSSPLISNRLQQKLHTHFKIEAGFLAQQMESLYKMIAEANEQVHKKGAFVEIIVRWDKKDTFGD